MIGRAELASRGYPSMSIFAQQCHAVLVQRASISVLQPHLQHELQSSSKAISNRSCPKCSPDVLIALLGTQSLQRFFRQIWTIRGMAVCTKSRLKWKPKNIYNVAVKASVEITWSTPTAWNYLLVQVQVHRNPDRISSRYRVGGKKAMQAFSNEKKAVSCM